MTAKPTAAEQRFPRTTRGLSYKTARRIATDPTRYAVHFQIWLSLTYAANGWSWPALGEAAE